MRGFTLEASYWDFMWPRVMLGAALGMIFPPLTRLTLSNIPRVEMGNATGMYNLLRNIGGSVGIALSATMLTRLAQFYQANLVGHINQYNPLLQSRFRELTQAATTKGLDAVSSQKAALGILYRIVERESGLLAYTYIFWILGIAFLTIIPFLYFLRRPRFAP
jgi:DHA2 family multidrug resistance protein